MVKNILDIEVNMEGVTKIAINNDAKIGEKLIGKARHATALFHGINNLQKQGLFCDTVVNAGDFKHVPAHQVMLLSAKEANPFCKSMSESSDGQNYYDNDVEFSQAYLSEDDDAAFLSNDEEHMDDSYSLEHLVENRLTAINKLRLETQVCDITLEVDNVQYRAHRVVLAAASNYFCCMFKDNLREKNMECINMNSLNNCIDTTYFPAVLNFIYTGEIAFEYGNAMEILCLAIYLQIDTLIKECQNYLISQVCLETCCELAYLSSTLCLEDLKAVTTAFIHDHFCELNGRESHLDLIDEKQVLCWLQSQTLGGNKSSTESETMILNNVLSWMEVNNAYKATELLLNVRFPLISKDVIKGSCDKSSPLYNENQLFEALRYHDNIFEQPLLQNEHSELRTSIFNWVCIDGVLAPSTLKLPSSSPYIQPYGEKNDIKHNAKGSIQNIRDPFHSVLEFNGFIYTLGGTRYTSEGYSNEVIRYDPRLDQSIAVAPMNENRGDFYCCVKNNFIYVFGGRNKHGALSRCERYDPRTNKWEYIASIPNGPLYMMAGEISNNSIIISGGFNDSEAVTTIHKFNCDTMKWEDLNCQLWTERGYHVMIRAQDEKLYIIGGVDNPFAGRNVWEVEVLDPQTEDVQLVGQVLPVNPFLSVQRLNALVNEEGDICIFAVTNTDNSSFIKYNIEKNLWETITSPINLFEIYVNLLKGNKCQ